MKIQQHDGVVVDAAVTAAGLRCSLRRRRCWRGEGGAKTHGCGCPLPFPPLYRPPGGRRPWEINLPRWAAAKGGGVPPKASGAPPPRVSNPRRRGAQGGAAPDH